MTILCLAGTTYYDGGGELVKAGTFNKPLASRINLLESFFYIKDWQTDNIKNFKSFMLDSGAYTFVYGSKETANWNEYLERYIQYIKDNNVELFFELDIDDLVGYDKVKEIRKRIEKETNKQSIPVWHKERGKDEWLRLCDEYDYVAIGGIAGHSSKKMEPYIPWLTSEAHKRGTKVHGLGFTRLEKIKAMGFDSVDSTAWLYGNIGGYVYLWDGTKMNKRTVPPGKKLKTKDVARHNFMQWIQCAEAFER